MLVQTVKVETIANDSRTDEFDDIVQLLQDYAKDSSEETVAITNSIAQACMGQNHLWQDMTLPNRDALNELMRIHYPNLAAKNVGNMKWKKFFYRQLCEREDVLICKSPSCGICIDYDQCFGPEN